MLRRVSLLASVLLCLATSGRAPALQSGDQNSPGRIRAADSVRALTQPRRVEALLDRNPPAVIEAFLTVERERTLNFARTNPPSRSRAADSPTRDSLPNIQRGIAPDEALLSLYVGPQSSCLWALTKGSFEFHRLPLPTELTALAHDFRLAVESNSPSRDVLGNRLFLELFGGLSAGVRRKLQWLLTADDTLFDVPFATLVVGNLKGHPVYLVEEHPTQRISSAMSLPTLPRKAIGGAFLGIGDGIYNTADSRWTSRPAPTSAELAMLRFSWPASPLAPENFKPAPANGTATLMSC